LEALLEPLDEGLLPLELLDAGPGLVAGGGRGLEVEAGGAGEGVLVAVAGEGEGLLGGGGRRLGAAALLLGGLDGLGVDVVGAGAGGLRVLGRSAHGARVPVGEGQGELRGEALVAAAAQQGLGLGGGLGGALRPLGAVGGGGDLRGEGGGGLGVLAALLRLGE